MEGRSEAEPWNEAASPGPQKVYQAPVSPQRLALPVQGNVLILRQLFRYAIQNVRNNSLDIDLIFLRVQLRNVENRSLSFCLTILSDIFKYFHVFLPEERIQLSDSDVFQFPHGLYVVTDTTDRKYHVYIFVEGPQGGGCGFYLAERFLGKSFFC